MPPGPIKLGLMQAIFGSGPALSKKRVQNTCSLSKKCDHHCHHRNAHWPEDGTCALACSRHPGAICVPVESTSKAPEKKA